MSKNNTRRTLRCAAEAETEEKKSVFIGYAAPVKSEDEAKSVIEERKRMYADATHNVWAYYLNDGAHARASDDGEPQGTAGMPVLNVLKMSGGTDMCVVVTRYFGGTLLGAGGLVRAYSAAAKAAVDAAGIADYCNFAVLKICVSYSDYQKLTVKLAGMGVTEDGAEFGSGVTVTVGVKEENEQALCDLVSELTNGRGTVVRIGTEERPST